MTELVAQFPYYALELAVNSDYCSSFGPLMSPHVPILAGVPLHVYGPWSDAPIKCR